MTSPISDLNWGPMSEPVPQRIPPLTWRKPAFIWTPVALAAAIAWPTTLFQDDPGLQRLSILAGFAVFVAAMATLSLSWALGKAPKSRRVVVLHVLGVAAITAFAGPPLLAMVLPLGHGAAPLSATPLALVMGLPIALVSGLIFAWLALTPGALRRRVTEMPDGNFRIDAHAR